MKAGEIALTSILFINAALMKVLVVGLVVSACVTSKCSVVCKDYVENYRPVSILHGF